MHRHSRKHVRREFFRARRRAALDWDRRFGRRNYGPDDDEFETAWRKRWIIHHAVDRKPCSCSRCGNPRRYWDHGHFTIQTIRDDLAAASDIEDAYLADGDGDVR